MAGLTFASPSHLGSAAKEKPTLTSFLYASFWKITRTCQKNWVKSAGTVPAIHQPPGSPDANDRALTPARCHLMFAVAIRRRVFLLTPALAGEVSMADCKTFSVTCLDSALRRNASRSTLTPGNASAVRRTKFQTSSVPRPGGNSSLLVEGVLGRTLTLSIVSGWCCSPFFLMCIVIGLHVAG